MDFFNYRAGRLLAEEVEVERIASEVGTPVYVYSKATLLDHLRKVRAAYQAVETTVCFSVKACSNVSILRLMAAEGSGFDIVSGGELYRVLQAGADPSKVVYAGVGKTDREIVEALDAGIGYFNIESEEELTNLIRLAKAPVAAERAKPKAALRVNPDVDYKTHVFLTTGKKETKFGVDIERAVAVFDAYADNPSVDLCALHVHLGTGGKTIDPYVEAVEKALVLVDRLREKGYRIEALDLGGGYGADYETDTVPSAAEYAAGIVPLIQGRDLKLILEPGKSICANAGILVTRVLYTKQGGSKRFVIVDAAMNDLIRPSLYDAFHFIWPVRVEPRFEPAVRSRELDIEGSETVDVVGPICEGADFLAKDRPIPHVERGDLMAVFTAGAYGFTMSSNYNARCRAAEVLVDARTFQVIRKRESYEDLVALER
ncbi:MAG TPA: diaminopimelate decarboxylase [Sedimentisphaerales bacterium]|nr:diaminopimelate decarboxylase [Sedimentisphaerales bacterium]HRS11701.1 diaminopimelate decarboxylase [Sedimentisphaerales bacterium]HRV48364.1 diaminopimelate decarboxylase [Sedimentisphaerales bacterium]